MHQLGFGLQLDSGGCVCDWEGGGKCLKRFGGPGEIRTHDLFHAMVAGSITYEETRRKQKTCTTAIWTSFGPHALFHACLDLERSTFRDAWLRPGPHVAAHIVAHARGRIRLANSSSRTKKRASLYGGWPSGHCGTHAAGAATVRTTVQC